MRQAPIAKAGPQLDEDLLSIITTTIRPIEHDHFGIK